MIARLRPPFHSLSGDDFIARGSGGQVFAISQRIVLKCPTLFDDAAPEQNVEMQESIDKIENEKKVYDILRMSRHPHIVYGIRCIPQGIFLQRHPMTLQQRIDQAVDGPIASRLQERWVRQLASAMAWLEQLGFVHGDLRPANVFLTARGDVQLGDFDSTVKAGDKLVVASEPFCKLDEDYELPIGGPITEQFALASCIYTLRAQHLPWHDIDTPTRICKFMRNEFPDTAFDDVFGEITSQCWLGGFSSVRAVEEQIVRRLRLRGEEEAEDLLGAIDYGLVTELDTECDEFVDKNS